MSKSLAVLFLAAVPFAAVAAPESFTADAQYLSINFSIDHLGLTNVYGRFTKSSAKFTMDRAAKTGSVDVAIETASVDTNDGDKGNRPRSRDEHLRTADFFNAAEFPRMTYKSSRVTFSGDNPSAIEGSLTLLGVTKPVALTIERFKCNPATPTAKERCGGVVVGKIKRSEFGMNRQIPSIGDEVAMTIGFEGNVD